MAITKASPTKREKEMLIVGIATGGIFSFLGSYVVATTFRMYDYGYSYENIMFFVTSLALFIIILLSIPKIIKKI